MATGRKRCICEICTCGKHICPHRKGLTLGTKELNGINHTTEYHHHYPDFPQDDPTSGKQRQHSGGGQEEVSKTNMQDSPKEKAMDFRKTSKARTVEGKGNGRADSNKTWSAKQVPKTMSLRRPDNLKHEGYADFTTIHQQDFTGRGNVNGDSAGMSQGPQSSVDIQHDSWNQRQIPKTQPFIRPDNLKQAGYLDFSTTHGDTYKDLTPVGDFTKRENDSYAGDLSGEQKQSSHRPRTSLRQTGEFQSESSYQKDYNTIQTEENKKTPMSHPSNHLKPEGTMHFDTTSVLDYNARVLKTNVQMSPKSGEAFDGEDIRFRSNKNRPQSNIKISSDALSSDTTATTDYRKWNVAKPSRHKPEDNLKQLGTAEETPIETPTDRNYSMSETEIKESNQLHQGRVTFGEDTYHEDFKPWRVTRPIIQKPTNHLKPEGDRNFATTHNVDYIIRDREGPTSVVRFSNKFKEVSDEYELNDNRQQTDSSHEEQNFTALKESTFNDGINHEINTEQTMSQTVDMVAQHRSSPLETIAENDSINMEQSPMSTELIDGNQDVSSTASEHYIQETQPQEKFTEMAESVTNDIGYLTWDQIRPKPIRPQNNLRQQGNMEFSTTSHDEFTEKPMERVKGIRPKTTTKITGDFENITMNQIMYGQVDGERVNPIRPKSNLHVETGDFVDETTFGKEFQAWPMGKPLPILPKGNLIQEGSMDFTTTHHTEFEHKQVERVSQIRPKTTNKIYGETGKFDETTTSRVMHPKYDIEKVESMRPKTNLKMSSATFGNETTNKMEFQDWGMNKPNPIRPVTNMRQEGDMDFTTMNQVEFDEKPIEKVVGIRPKSTSKITGDFDGTTTNQVMYQNLAVERPHEIRPHSNLHVEQGDFVDETTTKREFPTWGYSKPVAIKPRSSVRHEGDFDFTTTNQTQFEEKPIDRVSEIRPKTSSMITGDFDGVTTNQAMFQNFQSRKLSEIRPKTNLQLENGKFEEETTTGREFQQWEYSKPIPIKPQGNLLQEGSMDFKTSNQVQFEGKQMEKVNQIRPHTSEKITGDFDGTTTNRMMYQTPPMEKIHDIRPTDNIHVQSGTFANETTTGREYAYRSSDKPEPIKPKNNLSQEGGFDFTTSNQLEFEEKPILRVSQIRPQTMTKPAEGEFYGTTTNNAMFQVPEMQTVKQIRPQTNIQIESGKFHDNTTATEEYQQWQGERPAAVIPVGSLKQEGNMTFETTNQREFGERVSNRVQQVRPKTATKIEGEFDSTTTNQIMFPTHTLERVQPIRQQNNLYVDEGQFSDETTTRKEYRQWVKVGPETKEVKQWLSQKTAGLTSQEVHALRKGKSETNMTETSPKFQTQSKQTEHEIRALTTQAGGLGQTNNLEDKKGHLVDERPNEEGFRQWVKVGPESNEAKSWISRKAAGKSPEVRTRYKNSETTSPKILQKFQKQSKTAKETKTFRNKAAGLGSQEGLEKRKENYEIGESSYQEASSYTKQTPREMKTYRIQAAGLGSQEGFEKRREDKVNIEATRQEVLAKQFDIDRHDKVQQAVSNINSINEKSEAHEHYSAWKINSPNETTQAAVNDEGIELVHESAERNEDGNDVDITAYETAQGKEESDLALGTDSNINDTDDKTIRKSLQRLSLNGRKAGLHYHTQNANMSTVTADYGAKPIARVKAIIPMGNLKQEGDMDFSTTTQREYTKKTINRLKQDESIINSTQKLETFHDSDQSLKNAGYQPWRLTNTDTERADNLEITDGQNMDASEIPTKPVVHSRGKRPAANGNSKDIDVETMTQVSYHAAPQMKTPKRHKPDDNLKPENVPFNGCSTTKSEFKKWDATRSSPKRRSSKLKQEGTMEFSTTSEDYSSKEMHKEMKNQKSRSKKPQENLKHTGDMDFSTTTNSVYLGNITPKTKNLRPKSTLKIGDVRSPRGQATPISSRTNTPPTSVRQSDLTTTTRDTYKGQTSERTRTNRPSTSQKVGGGTFEGKTTTQSVFTLPPDNMERTRRYKPQNHHILEGGNEFNGNTTYRCSFEALKANHNCPVVELEAGRSKYTFKEEINGHRFYLPLVQ